MTEEKKKRKMSRRVKNFNPARRKEERKKKETFPDGIVGGNCKSQFDNHKMIMTRSSQEISDSTRI